MIKKLNPYFKMLRPILIVEDDPSDLELTLIALERSHLANPVVSVRDGVEAMDYLLHQGQWASRDDGQPAVILLDKKLPRMDGHQVLQAIREHATLKYIPVVMLTSSREEQDLTKSYDLGVNAYVVKPVVFNDFMSAIKDLGMFWAVLNETSPRVLSPAGAGLEVTSLKDGDGAPETITRKAEG